jgi:hypothetical protein
VTLYGLPTANGSGLRTLKVRKKSAQFAISAGTTKPVLIRLSQAVTKALPKRVRLKKSLLLVMAADAAGNHWELKRMRPLLVAKRG